MSCICLDTNWFLKGLESPCPPDWTALSALFSENSDAFSLPRFPMQVHDVLLAYGILENPRIRGVNRDLWIHERDCVYCCRFSAQANVPSLLNFDGVDNFADVCLMITAAHLPASFAAVCMHLSPCGRQNLSPWRKSPATHG